MMPPSGEPITPETRQLHLTPVIIIEMDSRIFLDIYQQSIAREALNS